jgi:hypothetical protein
MTRRFGWIDLERANRLIRRLRKLRSLVWLRKWQYGVSVVSIGVVTRSSSIGGRNAIGRHRLGRRHSSIHRRCLIWSRGLRIWLARISMRRWW